jgi:hypothetical protein
LGLGDGLQPEAKAVANAHGQGDDGRAANQHLGQGKGFVLHPLTLTNLVCAGADIKKQLYLHPVDLRKSHYNPPP